MRYLTQDAPGGGGADTEAAREEAEYFQRIEEHFGQRRGGPLVLSPKDWLLIQRWHEKGVPLAVVLRGINVAFDRFAASGPRPDRLNTLSYCAQHVEAAWEEHRRSHAGSQAGTAPGSVARPSPALEHLRAVARACRDAILPELSREASAALEEAALGLESLADQTASGEFDASAVDIAANALERKLEQALDRAEPSGEPPPRRRHDLHIPRFSPYAV